MRSKTAPPRRSLFELRAPIPAALGYAFGAAAVGLVFIAWCVASYVRVEREGVLTPLVPHYFLPAPDAVLKGLLYLIFERNLFGALAVSALRIAKAIALSIAVAFPLGIAMGSFEAVRRALDPLVAPMRYLPITAFIPLLILWFGIDEGQKVAFLFLGTSVYLIPAVTDAVRAVPEELVQTALTLGATRMQVVRTVLVPAALPQIFDGFRVLNAISWTYIILAEIVNPQSGIGYILRLADQHLKPEWSFAGIFVVGVVGILTDLTIRGVNQLLFHDQRSNG